MDTVKQIIFTLCLASFSAGVLLHLFPDAAARRCMKAVAGLYILSAVLGGVQDGSVLLQELQTELVVLEGSLQSDVQAGDESSFESALLTQASQSLEAQYNAYLTEQGYDATVAITLVQGENSMIVQGICVMSAAALSPAQESALADYFMQALDAQTVSFISEKANEEAGKED